MCNMSNVFCFHSFSRSLTIFYCWPCSLFLVLCYCCCWYFYLCVCVCVYASIHTLYCRINNNCNCCTCRKLQVIPRSKFDTLHHWNATKIHSITRRVNWIHWVLIAVRLPRQSTQNNIIGWRQHRTRAKENERQRQRQGQRKKYALFISPHRKYARWNTHQNAHIKQQNWNDTRNMGKSNKKTHNHSTGRRCVTNAATLNRFESHWVEHRKMCWRNRARVIHWHGM